MVTKKFGIDFNSYAILVLDPDYVFVEDLGKGYCQVANKEVSSKTHENGWTISGMIIEDWFYWVNEFEATHPNFGRVWGDFAEEVYADSEEGYQDFYKNFPPHEFDYDEI